jgi:hypothetical protein
VRSRETSLREIEALEEIEAFIDHRCALALNKHSHAGAPHQNAPDLLDLL